MDPSRSYSKHSRTCVPQKEYGFLDNYVVRSAENHNSQSLRCRSTWGFLQPMEDFLIIEVLVSPCNTLYGK